MYVKHLVRRLPHDKHLADIRLLDVILTQVLDFSVQ